MKIIYKVEEGKIISVEADTEDYCSLTWITSEELRRRAQEVLDGKRGILWDDGDVHEPATRFYAAITKRTTQIEEIRDMDRLCYYINKPGYEYYEINVEDSLI